MTLQRSLLSEKKKTKRKASPKEEEWCVATGDPCGDGNGLCLDRVYIDIPVLICKMSPLGGSGGRYQGSLRVVAYNRVRNL